MQHVLIYITSFDVSYDLDWNVDVQSNIRIVRCKAQNGAHHDANEHWAVR
jgi:hypothetical protein